MLGALLGTAAHPAFRRPAYTFGKQPEIDYNKQIKWRSFLSTPLGAYDED
jgi:hypothetical protein